MAQSPLNAAKASIRKQGPCAMCGGPFAAHRTIDSQMGRVANGESLEDVAAEWREESAQAMVWRWFALSSLLQDVAFKDKAATERRIRKMNREITKRMAS